MSGRKPGGTKTGGRAKGSKNIASAKRVESVAASGQTPLDYLLSVMRDASAEISHRIETAKAAAQYVHPKLSAVELTGKDGGPIETLNSELPLDPMEAARIYRERMEGTG